MSDSAFHGNNGDDSSDSDIPWSYRRIQSHSAKVKKEPMRNRYSRERHMNGNYTSDEEDLDRKLFEEFPIVGAQGTYFKPKKPLDQGTNQHESRARGRRQDCGRASPEKSIARERSAVDSSGNITLMTETVYKCNRCHKTFFTRSGHRKHQRNHPEENNYTCTECGDSFPDWATYTLHNGTHTGNQHFSLQSHLMSHKQSHAGRDRLYQCSVCAKCFAHSSSLTSHMAAHAGEEM